MCMHETDTVTKDGFYLTTKKNRNPQKCQNANVFQTLSTKIETAMKNIMVYDLLKNIFFTRRFNKKMFRTNSS